MAFNTAALRCYEAVGFRREGVIRKQVFRAGSYHDVVVLGLLREEWQ
jgi:RimJ/RimL family protein N-acetyltransferase